MAGGAWSPTETKVRPGFYMNFVAAALAAIKGGTRGIVALPLKANWGPIRQFVEFVSEAELISAYTSQESASITAYTAGRFALLGGAKKVLGYRLADGTAAKASITLKDTTTPTAVDVLKLETKYETTRDFRVTTRANAVDATKQDIVLYEGTTQLRVFTFAPGAGGVDNAVAAVNNDSGNLWVTATKLADGNGTLATVSSSPFAGGNNGTANITSDDYINAMAAFEARDFNVFTLDGMTDAALQASVKAWIERLRNEGKGVIAVMGGTSAADADVTQGNTRSTGFNHEGVVNVITSAKFAGTLYSSAQIAPYIAGLIAGQRLNESTTYAVCPFEDVSPRLTNSQIEAAIKAGSFVLVHDGEKVKCEKGINTLTSLRTGQNDQWKKIRTIRVMDAINGDLLQSASDNYIGKVNNNDDGKMALINACKAYMDKLVLGGLLERDFAVYLDPDYHPALAQPDEVYVKWEARIVDSMERIYGTFVVR